MVTFIFVAVLHVKLDRHLATRERSEAVAYAGEIPRHQGEEITGLGKGVVPYRVVMAIIQLAGLGAITIGQ